MAKIHGNLNVSKPLEELDDADLAYLVTQVASGMQYEYHVRILQVAARRIISAAHEVAEAEREAAIEQKQCEAMTDAAADLAFKLMAAEKINQNLEKIIQDLKRANQDLRKTTEASGYSLAYGIHGDEPSTISFTYDP